MDQETLFAILLLQILWRSKELMHKTLGVGSRIYFLNLKKKNPIISQSEPTEKEKSL